MNPVNWFEIPVSDFGRAKSFYEKVFGYELSERNMDPWQMAFFPMDQEKNGATGALVLGEGYKPSHEGTVVYFSVKSIEDTLEKINAQGGKTLVEKKSIGEHGFIAMFEDSEGNRAALHSV